MCTAAAVSVNDDFAACKSCIPVRAADNEFSGWVHVENQLVVEHSLDVFRQFFDDARQENIFNVVIDGVHHLLVGCGLSCSRVVGRLNEIVVLCADNDGVDAHRLVVFVVFHCHLAL